MKQNARSWASCFATGRTLESVADRLTRDDFSDPFLGRVFDVLVAEASAGRAANLLTIKPVIEVDPDYEAFGGWPALTQMTGSHVLLYDWAGLTSDLRRLSGRRRMINSLMAAMDLAADPSTTDDTVVEAVDAVSFAREASGDIEVTRPASHYSKAYVDGMNDKRAPGVTCGSIPALDEALGPMRPANIVVGAGRPGMGKTAVGISYAIGAARKGFGVLFVTIEMNGDEVIERFLSDLCFDGEERVLAENIRDRILTPAESRAVCRAHDELERLPLYIRDSPRLSPNKLDRVIRRTKRRMSAKGQKLDLVIVDYLQLMKPDEKTSSRFEAVTLLSNEIKAIAKAHTLPIFALAQLSRAVESRPDKLPLLSDLRESGAIEQDADGVVFFYRPEYYLGHAKPEDEDSPEYAKWREDMDKVENGIEFRCEKRRAGPGKVYRRGTFNSAYQAVR